MSTPEGRLKIKVKAMLDALPHCYRFMPVQRGFGPAGLDFYCCINGAFVAVETKVPGVKLSPRQVVTATAIAKSGGLVLVIRDDYDIEVNAKLLTANNIGHSLIYDRLGDRETYGRYLCQ